MRSCIQWLTLVCLLSQAAARGMDCGDLRVLLATPGLVHFPNRVIAAQNMLLRGEKVSAVVAAEHRLNSLAFFALENNATNTQNAIYDAHRTAAPGQEFIEVRDLQIGAGPNGVAAAVAREGDGRALVVTQGSTARLAPVFVHLSPHALMGFQTGARETFEADGYEVPNADNGYLGRYMRANVRAILGRGTDGTENFNQSGVATAINAHLAGAPVHLLTESRVLYTQLRGENAEPLGGADALSKQAWHRDTLFRSRVRIPVPGSKEKFFETWVYHETMTDAGGIGISRQAFKEKASEDVSRTLMELSSGDLAVSRNGDSGEMLHGDLGLLTHGHWRVISGDMFVKSNQKELKQFGQAGVFLGSGDTAVMSANHALARGTGPVVLFQRGGWAAQDPNVQSFVKHLPEGSYTALNADRKPQTYQGQEKASESRASIVQFEDYQSVRIIDAQGVEIQFKYKTDAAGKPLRDQNGLPVLDLTAADVARLKGAKTILTIQRRKFKPGEEAEAAQDQKLFEHAGRLLKKAGGGIRDLGDGKAEITSDYQVSGLGYTLTGFSREGQAQGFGGGTPKYRTVYGNIPGVDNQVPIGLEVAYVEYPKMAANGEVKIVRVEIPPGQSIVTGVKASQIPPHLRLPDADGKPAPTMIVTKEELRTYASKAGNGSPYGIESNAPRAAAMARYLALKAMGVHETDPTHDLSRLVAKTVTARQETDRWKPGDTKPDVALREYEIPNHIDYPDFQNGYEATSFSDKQAPHVDVQKLIVESYLTRLFRETVGQGTVKLRFEHEFLAGNREVIRLYADGVRLDKTDKEGHNAFLSRLFSSSEGKLALTYLNGVLRNGVDKATLTLAFDSNGLLREDSVRLQYNQKEVDSQLSPLFLQSIRTDVSDINRMRRHLPTAEGHEIDLRVSSPQSLRESGLDKAPEPWRRQAVEDANNTAISLAREYGLVGADEPVKVLRSFRKSDTKAGTIFEIGTLNGTSKGFLVLFPEGEYSKGLKYVFDTKELERRGIRVGHVVAAFNVQQGKEHRDFDTRQMIGVLVRFAKGGPMALGERGEPLIPAQRRGLIDGFVQLHGSMNLIEEVRPRMRTRFLENELLRMRNRTAGPSKAAQRANIEKLWKEVSDAAAEPQNAFLQGLVHGDAKISGSDGINNVYFDDKGRVTFTGNYHNLEGGLVPKDLAFATHNFPEDARAAFVRDYVVASAAARKELLTVAELERRTAVLRQTMKLWEAEYPLIPNVVQEP